jgi:deoxyadenosine/deoxycytidine kinase
VGQGNKITRGSNAYPYVSITGPVGSGKTTLTARLAQELAWTPLFESPNNNPFLADYYAGVPHCAYLAQAWFQMETLTHLHRISTMQGRYVVERDLNERHEVFITPLEQSGAITRIEGHTLELMRTSASRIARPASLMITLHCPEAVLLRRVRERGHEYERKLDEAWFASHVARYEAFWSRTTIPRLSVNSAQSSFGEQSMIAELAMRVRKHLATGL